MHHWGRLCVYLESFFPQSIPFVTIMDSYHSSLYRLPILKIIRMILFKYRGLEFFLKMKIKSAPFRPDVLPNDINDLHALLWLFTYVLKYINIYIYIYWKNFFSHQGLYSGKVFSTEPLDEQDSNILKAIIKKKKKISEETEKTTNV